MKRLMLIMAAMGASVLLASGVAYALTIQCDGAGDRDPAPGLCLGTPGDDEITGTNQLDDIRALNGFDRVDAGNRRNEIYGGDLGDSLAGEAGNDTYFGGNGADLLSEYFGSSDLDPALSGNDVLRGQAGDESDADEHYGGPGNDYIETNTFDIANAPDLADGGDGYDVCIVSENDTVVNCERIEVVPNPGQLGVTDAR